jgi:3-keto-5-aminohexanoate cleavage enzyme
MQERQIVPELEVFEGGMISNVPKLQQDGSLTPPFHVNFVLGFEGPLPADPRNLFFLRAMLSKDVHWGVIHDGMNDFSLLAVAIGLGASIVRVGFEDSVYFAPGEAARTNAELVTKVVELVRCLGCDVTTPNEAREIFKIRK